MHNNNLEPMEPKSNNRIYIIIIVLLLLALIGMSTLLIVNTRSVTNKLTDESFFDTQNAIVTGTIKNTSNNMITIENKKGIEKTLPMSPAFTVMATNEQGMLNPSTDLSKVELGKQYSLNLGTGIDGRLEVITVMNSTSTAPSATAPELTSPPPAPPVTTPKVATSSAKNETQDPAATDE